MAVNHVIGAIPPPANNVPTYQVLRVQRHGPLDVTLLADTVFGIAVHWVVSDETGLGETLVCWQHEKECLHHEDREEWAGFIPVYDHPRQRRAVLRLAPREYDEMGKVLGIDLRWMHSRVILTPTNAGQGKGVHVARAGSHQKAATIGPHDMERTICLVLHCDHIPRQTPAAVPTDPEVAGL